MTKVLRGTVHGRMIQLNDDPGLEDGHSVEIILRAKSLPGLPPGWREGNDESAGGLLSAHWTEEDDRILQEIYQERKIEPGRRSFE